MPGSSSEDPVLVRVRAAFEEARAAKELGEHSAARAVASDAIDALLTESVGADDEKRNALLFDLATFARESGDLKTAERAVRRVVEVRARTLQAEDADLQLARLELADTLFERGDLSAARALQEEVLEVFSRTLDAEHHDLQKARLSLAGTLRVEGELSAARVLQEQALEIYTRTLPSDDPDLQKARLSRGITFYQQGDLRAARALQEQALEVFSRTLPPDHLDLQRVRAALAITLQVQGDLPAARGLKEQVLDVCTRTLPSDHPDLQKARMNFGITLRVEGDLPAARALFEQVLEVHTKTLPPDHPYLQLARMNLANVLHAQGELSAARVLEEQVLEVYTRTLPPDHPDLQKARLNLGATLYEQGDLAAARALYEEALESQLRTLPPDHPDLQLTRMNLGSALSTLGDLSAARTLLEQVLEVYTRTLPSDHPELQRARLNLGALLNTQGDLAAARTLLEQTIEVYTRTLPPDHRDLQTARVNLANTLHQQGDVAAARALQEQVLQVYARTLPPEHPDLQKTRQHLASTLRDLSDLSAARALYEQVLEVDTRTLPAGHPDLEAARMGLVATLYGQGDRVAARLLQEQVLESLERTLPPEHPDLQRARMNLACMLHAQGDLSAARALFEQLLEVGTRTLPPEHPDLQAMRVGLATTVDEQGDPSAARALFEQVLEVRTRTLPADHPELQLVRVNLASTLRELGELTGARALLEQVLDSAALASDVEFVLVARQNLARTLAALGSANRGERGEEERGRSREQALTVARSVAASARAAMLSSSSRESEERCSNLQGFVSFALSFADGYGVFEPDPELLTEGFVLSETTRASALVSARIARLARSDERYGALQADIRAAGEELAHLARSGAAPEAYDAALAERDRAQRELVQLASRSSDAGRLLAVPDPALLADGLSDEEAIVVYRVYERHEIPPGETGERASMNLCAFVIRKRLELRRVELGTIEPIDAAVREWRDALGASEGRGIGTGPRADVPAASSKHPVAIRALVFDPLLPSLSDVRRLVIVLDDVLHAVPIDALPAIDAGDSATSDASLSACLGDRYEIELRSTLQEILSSAEPRVTDAELCVALGGADYSALPAIHGVEEAPAIAGASQGELDGTPPRGVASLLRGGAWAAGFASLPATLEEATGVAELAREGSGAAAVVLLENDEASRGSIEELAPAARFLHLATHGWFAPESVTSRSDLEQLDADGGRNMGSGLDDRMSVEERVSGSSPMLLCGLALAGANLAADALGRYPGLVTAEEVASWDLSNCELAVLSACDTNVGERRAGQGVASLQRALHMAGARTVITSLWKVPDAATKDLMLAFYRRIWVEKQPKARALWEAKRELRAAKDERGEPLYSPRDWAAWVLTGDPR